MPKVDEIRHARIKIAVMAYAYEIADDALVSDEEYDKLAYSLDTKTSTGFKLLDDFFKNEFTPDTGMWIHNHPELDKIAAIYKKYHEL